MADLDQLVINAGHAGKRGPLWQHLRSSSSPAAIGQMMLKKQAQDFVLRAVELYTFFGFVYTVSVELHWNSISLNSLLGSGHFEGDLKVEAKQQPYFFYI